MKRIKTIYIQYALDFNFSKVRKQERNFVHLINF